MGAGVPRRPQSADGWVALGFAAAAMIETVVRSRDPVYMLVNGIGASLLLLLALRRSRPLLAVSAFCAGTAMASLLQAWLIPHISADAYVPIFALLVAMYSVGAHGSSKAVAMAAPQPVLLALIIDLTRPHEQSLASAALFFTIFIVVVPVMAGRVVRSRALLIRRLEEQGRDLAEQQAAYVGATLARERLRVANELHHDLAEGMEDLVALATAVEEQDDGEGVAELETQARRLLAQTRDSVVALADTTAPSEAVASPPPAATTPAGLADSAQPWTVLAAGALAGGLIIEMRGLDLHVAAPVAGVACVVLAVPLAFAWARPLPAVAVLWAAAAVFTREVAPLQHTTSAIGLMFVPPFLVAALEPRRRALIGLAICWVGALATFGSGALPGDATLAVACWFVGSGFRDRTRLVAELDANNALLEQGRASLAARALEEDRMRMARELHDAIGHSLTVVALQAGAARRIWDIDRRRAQAMIDTVRTVAVAGLTEVRDGLEATSGQDAASLEELLGRARSAGLTLDARIDDVVVMLSPQQLATIYRVVQEALTNVLKHSPGATAVVEIRRDGNDVELTIANTPPTSVAPPHEPSGHGLSGMRHRVEKCGGRLTHGPSIHGGFVVRVRLPMAVLPA